MSENNRSMGPALRSLGDCAVQLTLRRDDFNVVQVMSDKGEPMNAPARTLIVVQARSYRELPKSDGDDHSSDIWELRVSEQSPAGVVLAMIYVHGEDILCVKAMSKVALG